MAQRALQQYVVSLDLIHTVDGEDRCDPDRWCGSQRPDGDVVVFDAYSTHGWDTAGSGRGWWAWTRSNTSWTWSWCYTTYHDECAMRERRSLHCGYVSGPPSLEHPLWTPLWGSPVETWRDETRDVDIWSIGTPNTGSMSWGLYRYQPHASTSWSRLDLDDTWDALSSRLIHPWFQRVGSIPSVSGAQIKRSRPASGTTPRVWYRWTPSGMRGLFDWRLRPDAWNSCVSTPWGWTGWPEGIDLDWRFDPEATCSAVPSRREWLDAVGKNDRRPSTVQLYPDETIDPWSVYHRLSPYLDDDGTSAMLQHILTPPSSRSRANPRRQSARRDTS